MSRLDLFFHFCIASFFCGIKYSCLLSCDLLRYSTTYVTDHFIILQVQGSDVYACIKSSDRNEKL